MLRSELFEALEICVVSQQKEPHSPHIPTLDGWRALAILLVLLGHGRDEIAHAAAAWHLQVQLPREIGSFGVQIFFALSGYLITTNLLEEEAWRQRASLHSFYLRRIFRILPAAFAYLLVVGLLATMGVLDVTPWRWLATLFLLSNYTEAPGTWYLGHFWSLAIEEHFYLLWPLMFIVLARNGRRFLFVVLAFLAVCAWRVIAFKYRLTWTSSAIFWGRTDLQVDGILCGVAWALLRRLTPAQAGLDALLRNAFTLPAVAVVVALLDWWAMGGWKSAFAAISLRSVLLPLLILATVVRPGATAGRLLESRPMRLLGKVSYSLYLWQQLFLVWDVARVRALAPLQSFPLGIACALACACASYVLVERPMIAVGRNWLRSHARAPILAPAA